MFFFYQEFHVRQDPYLYMPTAANNSLTPVVIKTSRGIVRSTFILVSTSQSEFTKGTVPAVCRGGKPQQEALSWIIDLRTGRRAPERCGRS